MEKVDNLFESVKEDGKLGKIIKNITKKDSSNDLNREKLKEFLNLGIEEGKSDFKSKLKNDYKLSDGDIDYLWQNINQQIKKIAKNNFDGQGADEIKKLNTAIQGKSTPKSDTLMNFLTKGVNQVSNVKNKGASGKIQGRKIAGFLGVGIGAAIALGTLGPDGLGEEFIESTKETLEQADEFDLVQDNCTTMVQSVSRWLEIIKSTKDLREEREAIQKKLEGYRIELEIQKRNQ